MNQTEPLREPDSSARHRGGNSAHDALFDHEDIRRLRARALRHQAQHRAVLDHLHHARVIAREVDCTSVPHSLDQLEVRAGEAMKDEARKVAEYDALLAAAAGPETRWQMVLRP